MKTNHRRRLGYFEGTIEAYTYPDSFYDDILTQRRPKTFGMSYRTGNPGNYKLNLIYNIQISPGGISRKQSEVDPFVWNFTCLPAPVPSARQTAHLIVAANIAYSSTIEDLENVLYGSDTSTPRLPSPAELYDIFEANAILRITDHGDGTWTAETDQPGIITMLDATTFQINWPSATFIDAVSYTISSL